MDGSLSLGVGEGRRDGILEIDGLFETYAQTRGGDNAILPNTAFQQEMRVRKLLGPLVKLASFKSSLCLGVRAYFDTRTLSTASILLVEASKIIEL